MPLWWDNKEKEAKDQWSLLGNAKAWVEKQDKAKVNIENYAPILQLNIPPQDQIKDLSGLPLPSQRYLMINFKKTE